MQKTGIEYLTHTWNPIAMRCTPVGDGCLNCWHLRTADRLRNNDALPIEEREALAGSGHFVLRERELSAPLKAKKAAVIGVQFMGDLFHEAVPDDFANSAYRTMIHADWHTYLILTKRPDGGVCQSRKRMAGDGGEYSAWPYHLQPAGGGREDPDIPPGAGEEVPLHRADAGGDRF